uniref:Uncharacterized protein n=1 Tax=Rhizophora mucronata TaxID=61149 RepID=A0A2P2KN86_RHIMU
MKSCWRRVGCTAPYQGYMLKMHINAILKISIYLSSKQSGLYPLDSLRLQFKNNHQTQYNQMP